MLGLNCVFVNLSMLVYYVPYSAYNTHCEKEEYSPMPQSTLRGDYIEVYKFMILLEIIMTEWE